ncbi:hypothetical protein GA0115240_16095 [Streptomyces sp. DvalAA-14]|uniref:hypothetical protein n=1 Tax=unclassified Streptomyces TaxID=2593676 RepID=UPI00081B1E11|nr:MULTISPECIES: hypothetical protein [unclassified Streptomyces]SCE43043.1 hypothetical protein GA0115240_16095 [Streptomyces sp. DvalAA-14]
MRAAWSSTDERVFHGPGSMSCCWNRASPWAAEATWTSSSNASSGSGAIRPLLLQSPEMGALPVLRAATDPGVTGGEFYGPRGFQQSKGHSKAVRSSPQSYDASLQRRLWAISEDMTGVKFPT